MTVAVGNDVVVLSADQACFTRVSRLLHEGNDCAWGTIGVEWMSDSTQLMRVRERSRERSIVVVVLDLIDPWQAKPHASARAQHDGARGQACDDTEMVWQIGGLLATIGCGASLPMLLVSDNRHLDFLFDTYQTSLIVRVDPAADDLIWEDAIAHLLAMAPALDSGSAETYDTAAQSPITLPNWTELSNEVQIDLDRCMLLTRQGCLTLTGQEVRILDVLLRMPGRFFSSAELAHRITKPGKYAVDEHCIRQTICELRRKLRDAGVDPQLLMSRRGHGYALVLAKAQPVYAALTGSAHASSSPLI